MPDNDQFARATRMARAAFIVCEDSAPTQEGPAIQLDQAALAAWIDKFFKLCGGLPAVTAVLAAVGRLNDAPLLALAPDVRERALDEIDAAVSKHGETDLDLVLRRAAMREVICGRYDERGIVERFFRDMIVRYAIDAKHGLVDRVSDQALSHARPSIENDMLPVVRHAASAVVRNHAVQQLHLAAHFRRQGGDIASANLIREGFSHAANA